MSFYKNLINGKYNTYEKVASADNDVVKNALNELSTEQINALAEELDIFTKEASEINLESSLFEDEEYVSCEIGKEASEEIEEVEVEAEEVEVEEVEEAETEEEIEVQAETEEIEAETEIEEVETETETETEEVETEEAETETETETEEVETEEEMEVEAEEDEFEIVKEACEQVGEYLVENDLTVADYVYSLTGLEKHASHIGEMAEKVAMVYDVPVVMAARDIISTMVSLADAE